MDISRFDQTTRVFSALLSRRALAGALGLSALGLPSLVEAKKRKRKRKNKKKITRNAFGCVDVGKFCQNHGQCCSGKCMGREPGSKKFCRAHNSSTCDGTDGCSGEFVGCTTDTGTDGTCNVTTGKASYCVTSAVCVDCSKDTDCEAGCGAGAACLVCAECVPLGLQTACASANAEGCAPV